MASKKSSADTSEDTKTIVTVLLLLFAFPIGLLLVWFWVKWPSWLKLLISIPVALVIFLMVVGVLSKAHEQNLDKQRMADVQTLAQEAGHYCFEHGECFQGKLDNIMEFINLTNPKLTIGMTEKGFNYRYETTDDGKNCVIKSKLSTGEEYSESCMRFPLE